MCVRETGREQSKKRTSKSIKPIVLYSHTFKLLTVMRYHYYLENLEIGGMVDHSSLIHLDCTYL